MQCHNHATARQLEQYGVNLELYELVNRCFIIKAAKNKELEELKMREKQQSKARMRDIRYLVMLRKEQRKLQEDFSILFTASKAYYQAGEQQQQEDRKRLRTSTYYQARHQQQ